MERDFEEFWANYPRKTKKGDAYKAWVQEQDRRPGIGFIVEKLKALKRSEQWRVDGGRFIPYPATWIRSWGWDDEVEVDLRVIEQCAHCGKEATKNTGNGWACNEHFYQVRDKKDAENVLQLRKDA